MKKSELKALIRECIQELSEAKKVSKGGPSVKKTTKGSSIGKGPSLKEGKKISKGGPAVKKTTKGSSIGKGPSLKEDVMNEEDGSKCQVKSPTTFEEMAGLSNGTLWYTRINDKMAKNKWLASQQHGKTFVVTCGSAKFAIFTDNSGAKKGWNSNDRAINVNSALNKLGVNPDTLVS